MLTIEEAVQHVRSLFPGGREEFDHDWDDFESSAFVSGVLSMALVSAGFDRPFFGDVEGFAKTVKEGWE